MGEHTVITDANLALARQLVESLEAGDEERAQRLLEDIARDQETELYIELGKLTRQFHDALNSFKLDSRLNDIAEEEIPDARERLNYVLDMTDQAADRSLTAVEACMPLCDDLERRAGELREQWGRFTRRDMSAEEFRVLSAHIGEFLGDGVGAVDTLRSNLNDILMAQDFQDLTGQIIKRVVKLVEELEINLVNLIRISGEKFAPVPQTDDGAKNKATDKDKAAAAGDISPAGPPVPGVSDSGVVSGQDEVDDLLSSLGF